MTEEGSSPLQEVMITIEKEFEGDTGLAKGADNDEYIAFMKHILPEFDEQRVYPSDIKKLISWYRIIREQAPEVLQEDAAADGETEEKED